MCLDIGVPTSCRRANPEIGISSQIAQSPGPLISSIWTPGSTCMAVDMLEIFAPQLEWNTDMYHHAKGRN